MNDNFLLILDTIIHLVSYLFESLLSLFLKKKTKSKQNKDYKNNKYTKNPQKTKIKQKQEQKQIIKLIPRIITKKEIQDIKKN